MPVTKKRVTVTPEGRTVVDANLLFQSKEVQEFLESVRRFHEKQLARKKASHGSPADQKSSASNH